MAPPRKRSHPMRLPHRQRERTQNLYDMFAFLTDHEDFVLEKWEAFKETVKKAEEEATKKALEEDKKNKSFFAGGWSFGQTLMFAFGWQAMTTFIALALWAKMH